MRQEIFKFFVYLIAIAEVFLMLYFAFFNSGTIYPLHKEEKQKAGE